jgi:hypothetical protein
MMTSEMIDKVSRFPLKQAEIGGIYCEPLKIHFPSLIRIVQTATRAQLDAEGFTDIEPTDHFVEYTIDPLQEYFGTVERETVRAITDTKQGSIVIRHHYNLKEAVSYLDAVGDLCGLEAIVPIYRIADGLFTMVRRPTDPSWPGPMVIHVAAYAANNRAGLSNVWQMGVAPDGTAKVGEYF